jgi:ParB family chromosome partitioning protein
MRLTLGDMGAKAAEAQALRAAIEAGESAVSLDPATIDASFVADRLGGDADDPDFQTFVEDIRAQGQLTPILVRPHPEREGRWQIAFGHRRWRAAKLLGRPVLAIARRLDDAALVIAQGQENAARRDLSFIEKAMFARTLEERGFSRPTLCAALSVHPSEAARLIGVARETPRELVAAIGPAPKAGRPRWMALAKALERDGALAQAMAALAHPDAARLDSDARFARAFAALREAPDGAPSTRSDEVLLADASGAALLRLSRPGGALRVEIDAARAPELARKIEALLRKEAARRAESG